MKPQLPAVFDALSELVVAPKAFRSWAEGAHIKAQALTADAMPALLAAYDRRPLTPTVVGDVAVIDIIGPITPKSSWLSMYFGCAAVQDLQVQFQAALDDAAVKTIVFRVDSPGGDVTLIPEFADQIFAARGTKPIIAIADTLIASAAYWIASQADAIYASASAQLGSIGVFCEHDDISGMLEKAGIKVTLIAHGDHKTEGNPYESLSDEARAEYQARVDEIGDWFDTAAARGRGVKKADVLANFGQGRVFRGKRAIAAGLADKAGTFGQVVGKLTKGRVAGGAKAELLGADVSAGTTHKTGMGSRQDAGCNTCSEACACDVDECPVDCPDCDPACPCRQDEDASKKKASAAIDEDGILASDAERDEAVIIVALSKRS
jgi:signal peptide peptidase SppA